MAPTPIPTYSLASTTPPTRHHEERATFLLQSSLVFFTDVEAFGRAESDDIHVEIPTYLNIATYLLLGLYLAPVAETKLEFHQPPTGDPVK